MEQSLPLLAGAAAWQARVVWLLTMCCARQSRASARSNARGVEAKHETAMAKLFSLWFACWVSASILHTRPKREQEGILVVRHDQGSHEVPEGKDGHAEQ